MRDFTKAASVFLILCYAGLFLMGFSSFLKQPGGFSAFYTAGEVVRHSGIAHLYTEQRWFYHLPYEAALLTPLTWLSMPYAFALWSGINLACLFAAGWILEKHVNFPIRLALFAFAPVLSMLVNGQDTAILLLLVVLAFDRFVRGRDFDAGFLLALGLFKFQFVIPIACVLAWRHRRVAVSFAAGAIALLFWYWLVIGTSGVVDYLRLTGSVDGREISGVLGNLRGVVETFSGSPHPVFVVALSCVLIVLASFLRVERAEFFAIAVLVAQLVSYHGHFYDALLLMVPIAVALRFASWPLALVFVSPVFLVWPTGIYWLVLPIVILGAFFLRDGFAHKGSDTRVSLPLETHSSV